MISVDSSILIDYMGGGAGADIEFLHHALPTGNLVIAPVVLTEILSAPNATERLITNLPKLTTLSILDGFWHRAGELRASLLKKGRKAHLADTLIAQSCIDHDVPLLTRDQDFTAFAEHGGLKLYKVA